MAVHKYYINRICLSYDYELKSATMLLLKISVSRYGIGLSNEPLFVIIAQGAAKVWHVKVGGPKRFDHRPIQTPFYKVKKRA